MRLEIQTCEDCPFMGLEGGLPWRCAVNPDIHARRFMRPLGCPLSEEPMEGMGMEANGERALHFGVDENGDMHVVTEKGHAIYNGVIVQNMKMGFGPEEGACVIVEDVSLEMERYADMVKRMKEGG